MQEEQLPASGAEYLTPAQVQAAIDAFDDATWARLEDIALTYGKTYRMSPKDLLQEALVRALEGERRCPQSVDVVAFIAMTARSIASAEVKKQRRLVLVAQPDDEVAELPTEARPLDEQLDDERTVAPLLAEILELFSDDDIALAVFEGTYVDRMSVAEVRELTGLSATAYDSKCRLVRRRLNKHFREEPKR